MRRLRKILGLTLLAVLTWLVSCVTACWFLTHRLGAPFAEPAPPGFTDERLHTQDGLDLGAWFQEGSGEQALVLLHGDENSRRAMQDQAIPYQAMGASLLLVSLRAHGDSGGRLNDFGWSARNDVVAAVEFLENKGYQRIYIDGVSLGAASAIFAGGQLGERVQGYILECVYQDLASAVDHRSHMFLPLGAAGLAAWSLEFVSPLWLGDYRRISPLIAVSEIPESVPILILAGGRDSYVPLAELEALADRVETHAQLIEFPDASHNDLRRHDTTVYDRIVTDFCHVPQGIGKPRVAGFDSTPEPLDQEL